MDYKLKLNSCYICVKDMKRAIHFYEKMLNQEGVYAQKGLFLVDGIRVCLYNYQEFSDRVMFGHNCLLNFEVDDIPSFVEMLEELQADITIQPRVIGNTKVLEFKDSEGNSIRVYSNVN